MPITALPTLDRTSATFKTNLDAYFLTALPTFSVEAEAARVAIVASETAAATSASTATTQAGIATTQAGIATTQAANAAASAASALNAPGTSGTSTSSLSLTAGTKTFATQASKAWVVGQPVNIARTSDPASRMYGFVTAYSAITGDMSVSVAASADVTGTGAYTDWTVSLVGPKGTQGQGVNAARLVRASNVIITIANLSNLIDFTGTFTQTLTAAATLGSGWYCYMRNAGNGDITVDPDGAELIDGAATYVLKPGFSVLLTCDGSGFTVLVLKSRSYDNIAQYTSNTTLTVPAGCYVMRPYAFGKGGDATTTNGGGGGGCAFGDIAVVPGQVVTFTIASGVATVTYGGVTLLTANPASGVTGGTASKHVSVTNGGAYSGGASVANGSGASSGSPLGAGYAGTANSGGAGWGGVGGNTGGGGVGSPATTTPGNGLSVPSIDPILEGLVGLGGSDSYGSKGQPGGGAGSAIGGGEHHRGGFGGGGGCRSSASGGGGGFGGGGGASIDFGSGGAGGLAGGGGRGPGAGGLGGAAVIRIYY